MPQPGQHGIQERGASDANLALCRSQKSSNRPPALASDSIPQEDSRIGKPEPSSSPIINGGPLIGSPPTPKYESRSLYEAIGVLMHCGGP